MLLIEKIAEEKIQEAIQKGEFKSLVLKGKPYHLDGYLYEDPSQRIEFKILRDHNFLPLPLELRKRIEFKREKLEKFFHESEKVYFKKLKNILHLIKVDPPYSVNQPLKYLNRHQLFLTRDIPLLLQVKMNSTLKMELFLFNRFVKDRSKLFEDLCQELIQLIEEYNEEIMKATLKRRDIFQNFTTMGKNMVKEKLQLFKKVIIPIPFKG